MTAQTNLPTVADCREWLRFPATFTQDDSIISDTLLPAAIDAARAECGDVVPKRYEEWYDGGDFSIWLRHKPILEVQLIEEGWGFTNYVLDFVEVNAVTTSDMFAYSIDMRAQGKISRRSGGNVNIPFIPGEGNIHVIYNAGRDSCPDGVRLFILQLTAYWYQAFEQRQVGTASAYSQIEDNDAFARSEAITTVNMGVPSWLIETLKGHRRGPIIG